jgi:hypothetical protein
MTEEEWLNCSDPEPMLEFLPEDLSHRKLQLFECACCRRIWNLIPPYHRRTVEVSERFADGLATETELVQSYQITRDTPADHEGDFDPTAEGDDYDPFVVPWPSQAAGATAFTPGGWDEQDASFWAAALAAWTRPRQVYTEERNAQAHLLRCIFGNPFRPIQFKPEWRTATVKNLAETIYNERTFDCLAILADAVEEGGCTSGAILDHCREPGPHFRGCWPLDLILGRT